MTVSPVISPTGSHSVFTVNVDTMSCSKKIVLQYTSLCYDRLVTAY